MASAWNWLATKGAELAVAGGVPALGPHVPVAIQSLGAWIVIQQASQYACPRLFPRTFARLSPRTRKQFDIHVVSMAHSLLVTTLAYLAWNRIRLQRNALAAGVSPAEVFADRPVPTDPLVAHYPPSAIERWVGYDQSAGNVLAICLGYFIWDAYTTVRNIQHETSAFMLHGLVCAFGFTQYFGPMGMWDGLGYTMWEASTPFLNVHWFLDKFNKTGSVWQMINAVFLLSAYVGARLVFGMRQSYDLFATTWFNKEPLYPPLPRFQHIYLSIACLALNTLNVIWFKAMIAAILKRFEKPKDRPAVTHQAKHQANFGSEDKVASTPTTQNS